MEEVKLKLTYNNGNCYLVIKYNDKSVEALKHLFEEELHLKKREITNGFGKGIPLTIWGTEERYEEQFKELLLNTLRDKFERGWLIDNINQPFISVGNWNVAIFRIVPNEKNEVKIPLDKFIDIRELRDIVNFITKILTTILNIVVEREIKIKVLERA